MPRSCVSVPSLLDQQLHAHVRDDGSGWIELREGVDVTVTLDNIPADYVLELCSRLEACNVQVGNVVRDLQKSRTGESKEISREVLEEAWTTLVKPFKPLSGEEMLLE